MAEITVDVGVRLNVIQSSIAELERAVSKSLNPDSSGFKAMQRILTSMRTEAERLQIQMNKGFGSQQQFNQAGRTIEKLETSLARAKIAAENIKFSDIKLNSSQQKMFDDIEQQIAKADAEFTEFQNKVRDGIVQKDSNKSALTLAGLKPSDYAKSFDEVSALIDKGVARIEQQYADANKKLEAAQLKAGPNLQSQKQANSLLMGGISKDSFGAYNDWFRENGQLKVGKSREGMLNALFGEFNIADELKKQMVDQLKGSKVEDMNKVFEGLFNLKGADLNNSPFKVLAEQAQQYANNINPHITNVQELESQLQIVHQLQAEMQAATAEGGAMTPGVEKYNQQINAYADALEKLREKILGATQAQLGLGGSLSPMESELKNFTQQLNAANAEFLRLQQQKQTFNSMKMAITNFMGFNQVLNLTKRAVSDAMNHIKQLDATMNGISIVTDMTTGDLWKQVDSYSAMAQKYGATIQGAYDVSKIYYQQGLETADVLKLTDETLKLSKISGLDYATTTDYMTTALRGFKMEMQDASVITDVYSALASSTAVSQQELAEAMTRTASSMESVGSTFQDTSAMIATMVAVTRESANNIGSAMKSIASRYGELTKDPQKLLDSEGEAMSFNKVDTALKSVGISMQTTDHQFRDFTDVIVELSEKWDTLDSTQQRYIATQFAGNRQQSRFLALVSNGDLLKENMETAANSEDTGTIQALKALDSIESKMNQVQVAAQQFYTTIGAEGVWKGALDGIKNYINTLNGMPKIFGKIPVTAGVMVMDAINLIKNIALHSLAGMAQIFRQLMDPTQGGVAAQASSNMEQQGQGMVQSYINGIVSRQPAVRDAFKQLFSDKKEKIGNTLERGKEKVQGLFNRNKQESTITNAGAEVVATEAQANETAKTQAAESGAQARIDIAQQEAQAIQQVVTAKNQAAEESYQAQITAKERSLQQQIDLQEMAATSRRTRPDENAAENIEVLRSEISNLKEEAANVQIKVNVNNTLDEIESRIQQIQITPNVNLNEAQGKLESYKQLLENIPVGVDDSRVEELKSKIAELEKGIELQINSQKIDEARTKMAEARKEIKALTEGKNPIDIDVKALDNAIQKAKEAKKELAGLSYTDKNGQQRDTSKLTNEKGNGTFDRTIENAERIRDNAVKAQTPEAPVISSEVQAQIQAADQLLAKFGQINATVFTSPKQLRAELTEANMAVAKLEAEYKKLEGQPNPAGMEELKGKIEEAKGKAAELKNTLTQSTQVHQNMSSWGSALRMLASMMDKSTRSGEQLAGVIMGIGSAITLAFSQGAPMMIITGIMGLISAVDMIFENAEERSERLTKAAEEASNKSKEKSADYKLLDRSINKLHELEEARYDSAEAAEEYQTAVDELADKYPQLITGLDAAGNATIEAANLDYELEKARMAAAEATLEAAKAERVKAENDLKTEEEKTNKLYTGLHDQNALETFSNANGGKINNWRADVKGDVGDIYRDFIFNPIENDPYSADSFINTLTTKFQNMPEIDETKFLKWDDNLQKTVITDVDAFEKAVYTLDEFKEGGPLHDVAASFITDQRKLGNTSMIDDISSRILNLSNLEGEAFDKETNEIINLIEKNNLTDAFTPFMEEIKSYKAGIINVGDLKQRLKATERVELSAAINTYGKEQQEFVENLGEGSGILTSWLYEQAETYKKDHDGATTEDYINKQLKSDYDEFAEAYGNLDYNIQEKFQEMWKNRKQYTADDIIKEIGLEKDPENPVAKAIRGYYKDNNMDPTYYAAQLQKKITSKWGGELKDGKRDFSLGDKAQENTPIRKGISELYNSIYNAQDTITTEFSGWIASQIDLVDSYASKGYYKNANQIALETANIINQVDSITDSHDQQKLRALIKSNNTSTREGIEKLTKEMEEAGLGQYISMFDPLKDALIYNLPLAIQAYIDNIVSSAEEFEKTINSAENGFSFSDAAKTLEKLNSKRKSGEQPYQLSDIFDEENGKFTFKNKEARNAYIDSQLEDSKNNLKNIREERDKANALLGKEQIQAGNKFNLEGNEDLKELLESYDLIENLYDENDKSKITGFKIKDLDQVQELLETDDIPLWIQNKLDSDVRMAEEFAQYEEETLPARLALSDGDYKGYFEELGLDETKIDLRKVAKGESIGGLDYKQIKPAMEKINSEMNNLVNDMMEKGIDDIHLEDYDLDGIFGKENLRYWERVIDSGEKGYADFVRTYGDYLGGTVEQQNAMMVQAIEKDAQKTQGAEDALKNVNFLRENLAYASLDTIQQLADSLGVAVEELFDPNSYDAALGGYKLNMAALTANGLNDITNKSNIVLDSINAFLDSISQGISNGLEGKLDYAGRDNLIASLKQYNIDLNEYDFTKTADGLKLSQQKAIELYNELKKIDAVAAKTTFDALAKSLEDSNEHYTNISAIAARIAELQKLINDPNVSTARRQEYEAELAVAEEIYRVRSSTDNKDFDFMNRSLPNGMQNPIDYWNSTGKAYEAMNKAAKSGYMEISDFYNIVNEMNNMAQVSGQTLSFMGHTLSGNAEDAAALIEAGMSALTNIDGDGVKIALGNLGVDFATGAADMSGDFDTGVKAMAKSQIKMLDAAIRMLEAMVAMENIDADGNGMFDLGEVFESDGVTLKQGVTDWIKQLDAAAGGIKIGGKGLLEALQTLNPEQVVALLNQLKNIDWTSGDMDVFTQIQSVLSGFFPGEITRGKSIFELLEVPSDISETSTALREWAESVGLGIEDARRIIQEWANGGEINLGDGNIKDAIMKSLGLTKKGKQAFTDYFGDATTITSEQLDLFSRIKILEKKEGNVEGKYTASDGSVHDLTGNAKNGNWEAQIQKIEEDIAISQASGGKVTAAGEGSGEGTLIEMPLGTTTYKGVLTGVSGNYEAYFDGKKGGPFLTEAEAKEWMRQQAEEKDKESRSGGETVTVEGGEIVTKYKWTRKNENEMSETEKDAAKQADALLKGIHDGNADPKAIQKKVQEWYNKEDNTLEIPGFEKIQLAEGEDPSDAINNLVEDIYGPDQFAEIPEKIAEGIRKAFEGEAGTKIGEAIYKGIQQAMSNPPANAASSEPQEVTIPEILLKPSKISIDASGASSSLSGDEAVTLDNLTAKITNYEDGGTKDPNELVNDLKAIVIDYKDQNPEKKSSLVDGLIAKIAAYDDASAADKPEKIEGIIAYISSYKNTDDADPKTLITDLGEAKITPIVDQADVTSLLTTIQALFTGKPIKISIDPTPPNLSDVDLSSPNLSPADYESQFANYEGGLSAYVDDMRKIAEAGGTLSSQDFSNLNAIATGLGTETGVNAQKVKELLEANQNGSTQFQSMADAFNSINGDNLTTVATELAKILASVQGLATTNWAAIAAGLALLNISKPNNGGGGNGNGNGNSNGGTTGGIGTTGGTGTTTIANATAENVTATGSIEVSNGTINANGGEITGAVTHNGPIELTVNKESGGDSGDTNKGNSGSTPKPASTPAVQQPQPAQLDTSGLQGGAQEAQNSLSTVGSAFSTLASSLTTVDPSTLSSALDTLKSSASNASSPLSSLGSVIDSLKQKISAMPKTLPTLILTVSVRVSGVNASGNATGIYKVFSKGNANMALAAGRGTLMGELGPELVVSGGRYFIAGQNGAEFVNLDKDAIVFNHLQTKKLMTQGHGGRGTAFTNEKNATTLATGNVGGPALASAQAALGQLKKIRAMWQSMLDASAKDLGSQAGRGGGGGGGGGGGDEGEQPTTTTDDIQRWYNWLRQIEHIEMHITEQEKLQTKYENDRVANGEKIFATQKAQLGLLDQEIVRNQKLADLQKSWYDNKRKELAESSYGKIFTYDEYGLQQYTGDDRPGSGVGLDILENLTRRNVNGEAIDNAATAKEQLKYLQSVGFNISDLLYNDDGTKVAKSIDANLKLKKIKSKDKDDDLYTQMMENFWNNVDSWRDELDSLYDSYHEQLEKVLENQSKQNEILQAWIDNELDVENQLLEAIESREQSVIDALQDQKDALQNSNEKFIKGLTDQLNKERDMQQKNDKDTELVKLQRQLAILQRSGGSASQIKSLQDQISQKQQDAYYDERQKQIDAIQEASDKQLERLDTQISIMNDTLEYQKANGLLWNEVRDIMANNTPEEAAQKVLDWNSNYASKSTLDVQESIKDFKEAFQEWVGYNKEKNTNNDFENDLQRIINDSGNATKDSSYLKAIETSSVQERDAAQEKAKLAAKAAYQESLNQNPTDTEGAEKAAQNAYTSSLASSYRQSSSGKNVRSSFENDYDKWLANQRESNINDLTNRSYFKENESTFKEAMFDYAKDEMYDENGQIKENIEQADVWKKAYTKGVEALKSLGKEQLDDNEKNTGLVEKDNIPLYDFSKKNGVVQTKNGLTVRKKTGTKVNEDNQLFFDEARTLAEGSKSYKMLHIQGQSADSGWIDISAIKNGNEIYDNLSIGKSLSNISTNTSKVVTNFDDLADIELTDIPMLVNRTFTSDNEMFKMNSIKDKVGTGNNTIKISDIHGFKKGKKDNYSDATFTDIVISEINGKKLDIPYVFKWPKNSALQKAFRNNFIKEKGPLSKLWARSTYLEGGMADYTGPAWLDGTKKKPEAVLNASQTEFLRNDLLGNKKTSLMSIVSQLQDSLNNTATGASTNSTDDSVNIEQVSINFNAGTISSDYDARRAGDMVKEEILKIARKAGNHSIARR